MSTLKNIVVTMFILLYIGIAVLFSFASDSLKGMARVTGRVVSDIPYMPPALADNVMYVIPALLVVLSVIVFVIYLRSE